jgi:hypothetical protein
MAKSSMLLMRGVIRAVLDIVLSVLNSSQIGHIIASFAINVY